MHASIRRFRSNAVGNDELAREGRKLAVALHELPGFVSFAMLESGPGCMASVTIFDDAGGLAAGEAAISRWLQAHDPELDEAALSPLISGEITVQRGM